MSVNVQLNRRTACQCVSENHTLLKGGDPAGKYFVGFADSLEQLACYLCQIQRNKKNSQAVCLSVGTCLCIDGY